MCAYIVIIIILIELNLCTTWHIFAEASESFVPLGTYSQRPQKVFHDLTYNRRGLRKLCTIWHIFTGSPNIMRETCESFATNGTAYFRALPRTYTSCIVG